MDKKFFLDTKSEMVVLPHGVALHEVDKSTREKIMTQVWTSHVKDDFVVAHMIQTKPEFSFATVVMNRIGGWAGVREEELKTEVRVEEDWRRAYGFIQRQSYANGQNFMQSSRSQKITSLWKTLIGSVHACGIHTTGLQSFPWYCRETTIWER